MKPSALLDESRIVLDVPPDATKDQVIQSLITRALAGRAEAVAPAVAALRDRELLMTTGIGQGVAVPHTRSTLVSEPAAVLGISRQGIEWDAVDGEKVHIIFAFVTPESQPALHVHTLGETATLFASDEVRRLVIAAQSSPEVLGIIRRHNG